MQPFTTLLGTRIGKTRWDFWNFTWPFARLTIHEDRIHVKVIKLYEYEIPKASVTNIVPFRSFMSGGVRIIHEAPLEPFFVLWVLNSKLMLNRFSEFGYPVSLEVDK